MELCGIFLQCTEESDRSNRLKEDALLLLRGFDSISHSLSQLTDNLDNALQVRLYLCLSNVQKIVIGSSLCHSQTQGEMTFFFFY